MTLMRSAISLCLLFTVIHLPGGDWPRYTSPMTLELRIPEEHPYLALTPAKIERAAKSAAASAWARQYIDEILTQANGLIAQPWSQLPPKGDLAHRIIGGRLFTAALAYAFSGDKRYAEWTRDGLLAYADLYPGLTSSRGGKNRLFTQSSLYESTWVVAVAQAYDLVAGNGVFTQEQAERVEGNLLRRSAACFKIEDFDRDERIKDLHFRCYNFQAWHIAAVGLVGLAVKDQELVDWAVNSPYGLRHLIAHDVNDDGVFWERSQSYHDFVLRALLPFTEAMLHCGQDLYQMSVPADRRRDEDSHYITDTSNRPKSLRMMFESLFYMTFPDLSYPALGDSNRGPLRANAISLVGAERYRDKKLAWLLSRNRPDARSATTTRQPQFGVDWQWLVYDAPADSPSSFPIEEGRFANTGEYRNGCSLFPSTGVVILREASGDYTSQPGSTAVSLSYGPHGGGHGHSDKLNIVLYAQGRQWIPDFGSMPYESRWKAEWTAQTISHNTVVVDGISQKPTGARVMQWPNDSAADRVLGVLERFEALSKSASAYCDSAYEGIRLRRAVRLVDSWVVDAFTVTDGKAAEHQYDYVLHIDGQLENSSLPLLPKSGKLGETSGYQLVEQTQRGSAKAPFTLTFTSEGKQLRLWISGQDATEVIVGDGLTNSPDRKMPMLVLRRKASRTRFAIVLEPVSAQNAIRAVRTEGDDIVIESTGGTRRLRDAL
jgi:Heparinase II/III-like protein/Alginate lyase